MGTVFSAWRQALRAWLWFLVSLSVLMGVLVWARPFTDSKLTAWLASASAMLLRMAGIEATVHGTTLNTSVGALEIVRECTGVYPMALYIAAVLAVPTSWSRKLLGIGLGFVAIQLANIVRIISLLFFRRWWPEAFETVHLVVWQSLMVFWIVLFWILWATAIAGKQRRVA